MSCSTSNPIRLFITDLDGTLTDGRISIDDTGHVSKTFCGRDLTMLRALAASGVRILVLADADEPCDRFALGVYVADGVSCKLMENIPSWDRLTRVQAYLDAEKIDWRNVAYIGDDRDDAGCLERAGLSSCPKDAVYLLAGNVMFPSGFAGGYGAVADFARTVLRHNESVAAEEEFEREVVRPEKKKARTPKAG